jgi:regulator of protease activity HflC (stomatin/prohibitin superfamily)
LIDKREAVRTKIEGDLRARLQHYGIHVDQVNMTNFDFTKEFNDAVERKVVALQNKATAQTDAETARIKAVGEAAAQSAQRRSLTPALLQKLAIDKWDGKLPQYSSTALPFLTVK